MKQTKLLPVTTPPTTTSKKKPFPKRKTNQTTETSPSPQKAERPLSARERMAASVIIPESSYKHPEQKVVRSLVEEAKDALLNHTFLFPKRSPQRWRDMYQNRIEDWMIKTEDTDIDPTTRKWIRNNADYRAALDASLSDGTTPGARFSVKAGQRVVDWIQKYCKLYEGAKAGEFIQLDDWQYEFIMQMYGWQVYDSELGRWRRRFRKAGIWIAKKNGKSPTLAATGLYMLIGDGEKGQHCYCVARDGKQARIAFTHAMEMVKNSPILQAECKINHAEGIIRHFPTASTYSIVFAENSRSTEGYNGSIFADETHVLEQALMDRLKRAGISREEPVHIEVSTAGNNADGYGMNRYEYGVNVAKAEFENYVHDFLFIDFSINQKVSMDQLRDKLFIESIAVPCNPSLGRILRFNEFMDDWAEAVQSETELRQFAMYRCNLWLRDSATWVELADWLRCSDSPLRRMKCNDLLELGRAEYHDGVVLDMNGKPVNYSLSDLAEYPCVAGLDLSKTRDLTSLTLLFAVPDDEIGTRPYSWTWHWLPEDTVTRFNKYINLRDEKYRKWLHIIKGKTIKYDMVASRLTRLRDMFDLRSVGYDAWNSTEIMRILVSDYGWNPETLLKVPQNMKVMAPITKEVERWIIRGEIHHPENLLLNWQFGHVALDFDRVGNYRVIKPESASDYRKVDGVVSLLIAAATLCNDPTIWLKSTGSILLFDPKDDNYQVTPNLTNLLNNPNFEDLE